MTFQNLAPFHTDDITYSEPTKTTVQDLSSINLIYVALKAPADLINGARLVTFNNQRVLFQLSTRLMSVLGSVWTSDILRTTAFHRSVHAAADAARTLNKPFSSAALIVIHGTVNHARLL